MEVLFEENFCTLFPGTNIGFWEYDEATRGITINKEQIKQLYDTLKKHFESDNLITKSDNKKNDIANLLKINKDASGETWEYELIDSDTNEVLISGDGEESKEAIIDFFKKAQKSLNIEFGVISVYKDRAIENEQKVELMSKIISKLRKDNLELAEKLTKCDNDLKKALNKKNSS